MSTQAKDDKQAYTVLARRFRPQGFADVVGQEHVSQALKNAISGNRVAHAYLFTGARGVGKTSTARILAKALNCQQGVDGNPCNECEICQGISSGNDVDVLEIDGASNNGVDDIRQLRANVNVMSMRTQYKVYIIDEVHMLSKGAFNALLKTLEEPPPKVKFVFCTTEPNKVPDTILSRVQRFDFGTIETGNIKGRLAEIAKVEGVEVDDDALELVARRAAGSMRDSQSLFDQLLAFGEEHISASDVHRLLGTATDDRLVRIVGSLVQRDQAASLAAFHQALDDGVQLGELTEQLLFYLRDLMILATGAEAVELLSVSPSSQEALAGQADNWGLQTIVAAMQILADTKGRMQRVTYGRALAELALVRIGMLEDLTNISGLIDRLKSNEPSAEAPSAATRQKKSNVSPISISAEEVQEIRSSVVEPKQVIEPKQLEGGIDKPPGDALSETGDVASSAIALNAEEPIPVPEPIVSEDQNPVGSDSSEPTEEPVGSPASSSSQEYAVAPAADQQQSNGDTSRTMDPASKPQPALTVASDGESVSVLEAPEDSKEILPAEVSTVVANLSSIPAEKEQPVANTTQSAADSTNSDTLSDAAADSAEIAPKSDNPTTNSQPMFAFEPQNANKVWAQVVSQINDMMKSHVKAVSNSAIFAPNRLEITFPKRYDFSKQFCERPDALGRLESIASELTGQNVRITLVVSEDAADVVDQEKKTANQADKKRVYKPEDDRFVANVMEAFGAQCVKVTPFQPQATTEATD
jgi:DNA polymerase III subunit gamma/tau